MTDEIPTPVSAPPTGPSTGEAWNDVVARMGELGVAISAWAKAAANDPQNRQQLDEIRRGVNEMAQQADAAFAQVANSDAGQQFRQGAQQAGQAIGDAAQQASEVAAPVVASAFSGLADVFGRAAARVDQAVSQHAQPTAPPSDEPPSSDEAPASPDDETRPPDPPPGQSGI